MNLGQPIANVNLSLEGLRLANRCRIGATPFIARHFSTSATKHPGDGETVASPGLVS